MQLRQISFTRSPTFRRVNQQIIVHSLCSSNGIWSKPGSSRHYSSSSPTRLRYCKQEGCGLRAGFGWADSGEALYCSFHKEAVHVDVKHKRCEHPGCDILRPVFGYTPKKGVRCASHKLPEMINVKDIRCEYEGCNSLKPAFGLPGSKEGRFCDKHKKEDMIDVKHRKCGHEGCHVQAHFGFLVARGKLLGNLMLSDMTILKHTKCECKGCKKIARFGFMLGEPLFCSEHKLSEMKDVASDRCNEHKLEGMLFLKKQCEQKGCSKPASFGSPGSTFHYCGSHKLEGMIQYKGRIQAA